MSKTVKTGIDAGLQSGFVKGGPTGSLKLPTGTTAERDAFTQAGQIRFNSQTNFLEFFNGSAFVQLQGATNAKHTITVDSYTGDGTTLTFAVTTYSGGIQHTDDSLLVFLNGVAQIAGVNYTVDTNGANVVFSGGDAPLSSDVVHILELPI